MLEILRIRLQHARLHLNSSQSSGQNDIFVIFAKSVAGTGSELNGQRLELAALGLAPKSTLWGSGSDNEHYRVCAACGSAGSET
jgi:hypothetical protein